LSRDIARGTDTLENVAPTVQHEFLFGLTYQYAPIFMSILVTALLCLMAFVCTRGLRMVPRRGQALMETIVTAFRDLVYATMGPKDSRKYMPLIGTIFLYVFLCNMIGLIPTGEITHKLTGHTDLHFSTPIGTFIWPGFMEPTRNVNTPWGLGIMVFFIMHVAAIARKGPGRYFDEYFTPHLGRVTWRLDKPAMRVLGAVLLAAIWGGLAALVVTAAGVTGTTFWAWVGGVAGAALIWCLVRLSHEPRKVGVPNILMFPLNVIGKLAEILSMSFRLFGNIFGGAVIIALLGGMTMQIGLPILLQAFMGIFVGTIQAFVFAMLALTYITVEISEDEVEEAIEEGTSHHKKADAVEPQTA
jgi:F0F1-type ATP synthase membrane subunit a